MTEQEKQLILNAKNQLNEIAQLNQSLTEALEKKDKELEIWNKIKQTDSWHDMKEAAKIIGIKGMERNTIYGLLRDKGILMYDNEPYQKYVNQEYFKQVPIYIESLDEEKAVTVVSAKGIEFIRKTIKEELDL